MAQALPRYCPRCGTPTRVDMQRCQICQLPAEVMLHYSSNPTSRPNTAEKGIQDNAAVPTPRMNQQQEGAPGVGSPASHAEDNPANWHTINEPAQPPQPAPFSPLPPLWDERATPGNQDELTWAAPPRLPPSKPRQEPPVAHAQQDRPDEQPMAWEDFPTQQVPASIPPAQLDARQNPPAPQVNRGNPAETQAAANTPPAQPDAWQNPLAPQANRGNPAETQAAANTPPAQLDAWQSPPAPQANWGRPAEIQAPAAPAPKQRKPGRAGLVVLVLVLLLALLGGGGYFAFTNLMHGHLPGPTPTQATIKTTKLSNSAVTYAGITVTVLSIEQAQNFVDDPQTSDNGMLRVNLQAQNPASVALPLNYQQSARLGVQGTQDFAPVYVNAKSTTLAPGATQASIVDFAVANGGSLNNTTLKLGVTGEAQILIPLNGQGNLSQYQPKTTDQNKALLYFGLNWTLVNSTTSWSQPGQQAASGMEYLTLNFTIDNTLSQLAISGSPYDYLRVKVGTKTIAPTSTDIPVSFESGKMGQKGEAVFLIPQNTTTGTLLFLSPDSATGEQTKVDFQTG